MKICKVLWKLSVGAEKWSCRRQHNTFSRSQTTKWTRLSFTNFQLINTVTDYWYQNIINGPRNRWIIFFIKNTHHKWSYQKRTAETVEYSSWQSWFINHKFTTGCLLIVLPLVCLSFYEVRQMPTLYNILSFTRGARGLEQCLFVCFPSHYPGGFLRRRCRETFPIYKFSPFSEYAISFEAKSFVFLLCYALTTLRAYLLQNFAKNVLCFYCHFCWFLLIFVLSKSYFILFQNEMKVCKINLIFPLELTQM